MGGPSLNAQGTSHDSKWGVFVEIDIAKARNAVAVTVDLALAALDDAKGGRVAEGDVGGSTGTASRVVRANGVEYTAGALVRANYGARELLRVDGVPVGRAVTLDEVPSPRPRPSAEGSIIVVLTTDAPFLPIQCQRLARWATTGLAWVGGIGASSSGEISIAFATGSGCAARSRSARCG
jgi:D-aminopeptidase